MGMSSIGVEGVTAKTPGPALQPSQLSCRRGRGRTGLFPSVRHGVVLVGDVGAVDNLLDRSSVIAD